MVGGLDCTACYRQLSDAAIPDKVTLQFRASPTPADVFVDGVKIGTTPLSAVFTTDKSRQFMLAKQGYVPSSTTFKPVTNGYVWAKLTRQAGTSPEPIPVPPAKFTTDEPRLGGFPMTMVVMGVIGLGLVGFIGYKIVRGR